METQRHEKEGQALLALRAACTYCTFIQIAHNNCNLDVGFWFISFSSDFLFLSWHNQGSGEMDSFFALMLPETVSRMICPSRLAQETGNGNLFHVQK